MYKYGVETPDGQLIIESENERTKDEITDFIRKKYTPSRAFTKEEVRKSSLPSGITLEVADGDNVRTYVTTKGSGLVPAENLGQGFELVDRLLKDARINEEQAAKLKTAWADNFAEMLDVGADDQFKRNALAGFQRGGLGSFRSIARLQGGVMESIRPQTDPRLIESTEDLGEQELERRRQASDKVVEGAMKELRDLAAINTLPEREGFLGKAADFGAMVAGGALSPESLISIAPVKGAAQTLLKRIGERAVLGAAENVAAEAAIQGFVKEARTMRGEDPTWKDTAADFLMAAAGGAALRNVFGAFGDVWGKLNVDPNTPEFQMAVVENIRQGDAPIDAIAKAANTEPEILLLEVDRGKDPLKSSSDIVMARLNELKSQVDVAMERANELSKPTRRTGTPILEAPERVPEPPVLPIAEPQSGLVRQPEGFTGGRALTNLRQTEEVVSAPVNLIVPERPRPTGEIIPQSTVRGGRQPVSILDADTVDMASRIQSRKQRMDAMQQAISDLDVTTIQESLLRQDPVSLRALQDDLRMMEEGLGQAPQPVREPPPSILTPAEPSARVFEDALGAEEALRQSPIGLRSLQDDLTQQQTNAAREVFEAEMEGRPADTVRPEIQEAINRPIPRDPIEEVNAELIAEGEAPVVPGQVDVQQIDTSVPPVARVNQNLIQDEAPTSKLESWADQTIRDSQQRLSANPFLDPSLVSAYAIKGMAIAKRAGQDFAKWSAEMVRNFGPWIKNKTKQIWDRMKEIGSNIKQGLIWHRYGYIDPIKNIKGADNLERIIQLTEPRIEGRIRDFRDFRLPTIRQAIIDGKKKLGMKERTFRMQAHDYAKARHAVALNKQHGEMASGMSTKEAMGIIESHTPEQVAAFRGYTDLISQVNLELLDMSVASGVMKRETADMLRRIYPDYVPYNRVMEETEDAFEDAVTGKQDAMATGFYRFKGFNDKEIVDILESTIHNYERQVRRTEKNLMHRAMLEHWRQNKSDYGSLGDNIFEEKKPKVIGSKPLRDDGEKVIRDGKEVRIPVYEDVPPEAVQLFENGERVWFMVKDKDMRDAILSSPYDLPKDATKARKQVEWFWGSMRTMNSLRSFAMTTMNPDFGPRGFTRDTQEVFTNLQRLMGDVAPSMVALTNENQKSLRILSKVKLATIGESVGGAQMRRLFRKNVDKLVSSEDVRLYRQFLIDGGSSGGRGTFALKDIEKRLEFIQKGLSSKLVIGEVANLLRSYNEVFEDANRFSVYRMAIERGFTRRQATSMARDSSFDTAKVGNWHPYLSTVHMFVSPSTQGAYNQARSLTKPKTLAKAAGSIMALNGMLYMWNEMVAPGWNDGVGDFARDFNLSLVTGWEITRDAQGNEKEEAVILRIPVAHALLPIHYMANNIYRKVFNYPDKSAGELFNGAAQSIMDGYLFVPVDETTGRSPAGFLKSMYQPQFIRPISEVEANRDWQGNKIVPDGQSVGNTEEWAKFNDYMLKSPTGVFITNQAEWMRENLGVDVSPEVIRHYLNSYLGGGFKVPEKLVNLIGRSIKGEQVSASDLPVIGAFVSKVDRATFERRGEVDAPLMEESTQYDTARTIRQRGLRVLAQDVSAKLKREAPNEALQSIATAYQDGLFNAPTGEFMESDFAYFMDRVKVDESKLEGGYRILKNFGVEDGSRARAIKGVMDRMDSYEEQKEFLQKLEKEPDIFSQRVQQQWMQLYSQPQ